MKKRILAMFLAAWMVIALAGCGGKEEPQPEPEQPVEEPEPAPETDPEPEQEPVEIVPGGTNPLTGLPLEPEYEKDRPVAVMFNNLKIAQPQWGISQADIIYEIPAEGGITRMIGVFQTMHGVGDLGSIRSTRPYYLEVALGHDALLVHAGGSPEAYQNISSWGVDNMDGVNGGSDAAIFWRDGDRRATMGYEHSMVTSGTNVREYLSKDKFRAEHKEGYTYTQAFAEDGTPAGGDDAGQITLKFSNYKTGIFDYDSASGTYLASQYDAPYMDFTAGKQVAVTNILMLETDISEIPGDKEGRLRVIMTGSGEGTYFCGGKTVPIRWSKADRNSQFSYTLEDGTPLTMGKGKSYICILDPDRSKLSWQ